jgi:Putative Flp pilus-assembly TadE/G-like
MRSYRSGDPSGGQALVFFVIALVALLVTAGLLIDGGAAFAQQRIAQNGSDSTATAGTLVVAERLSGVPRTGADVEAAVDAAALANELGNMNAEYTDAYGDPIGATVDGASAIPDAARGVHVTGDRTLSTSFARIIGLDTLTASANATAVAGALSGDCVLDEDGCALLPVTFPVTVFECDGQGNLLNGEWYHVGPPDPSDPNYDPNVPYWDLVGAEDLPGGEFVGGDPSTMAILPLCRGSGLSTGAFGWLDYFPGMNLADEIIGPLPGPVDVPDWFQTQTGNPNSVEDELMTYWHKPVLIPLHNGACRENPNLTGDVCLDPGVDPVGNNTWYYVHTVATFYIDQVLVQGNNKAACAGPPGQPQVPVTNGAGFLGCLKGWFTKYIFSGPIDPGADITSSSAIGIQLIQ